MSNKARGYTKPTIKKLFKLSGNRCAAPDCSNLLTARDGLTNIENICHIEAASPNGPRYNPSMTDDERRDFDNLILLCNECHKIIDNKENESKYSVALLKEWKKTHENACMQELLIKKPRLLNQAVDAIAEIDFEDNKDEEILKVFNIEEKIKYNSIKKYKYIIKENSKYYGKLNSLYAELEKQGSFKKIKLLKIISHLYLEVKGELVPDAKNEMAIIRSNADEIFRRVEMKIYEKIDRNISSYDDIIIAIPIIMVDAFMECKILEPPEIL